MSAILIDPRFRLPYYTYLLQGFNDLEIPWRFRELDIPPNQGMGFIFRGRKFWVDSDDMSQVQRESYEWADVIGKVNVHPREVFQNSKIRTIGPIFGIRLWNLPFGYLRLPKMVIAGKNFRTSIAELRFQGLTRAPLSEYENLKRDIRTDWIYHRSRAWEGSHSEVNSQRLKFREAVSRIGVPSEIKFSKDRVSIFEYLQKTSKSTLVFNSPAVHGCLGWKLGEFLALGKAIITTPIELALPAPLLHGEHWHVVDDHVDSIQEAITEILDNPGYRMHLEKASAEWFSSNLTPAAVVKNLIKL